MRVLVTRPEAEGERTAARLRARGHEVWLAPLLRIEPAAVVTFGPGPWAAVAFTSANAVRAVSTHARLAGLTSLPAYTVGARTREAAVAAGFGQTLSAEGDVEDLAQLIAASADSGLPLLYFAGAERAGDLATALAPTGRAVETVIAYRARLVSDFDADIRDAIIAGRIDAVLHYSARSAAAFLTVAQAAGPRGLRQKRQALLPVGPNCGTAHRRRCPCREYRHVAQRECTHRSDREAVKIKS